MSKASGLISKMSEASDLKNVYVSVGVKFSREGNNPQSPKGPGDKVTIAGVAFRQGSAGTGGVIYSVDNPDRADLSDIFKKIQVGSSVGSSAVVTSVLLINDDFKVVDLK